MPSIGFVTKQKDGNFKGQLRTLSFIAPIDILLNPTKSGSIQPDYRMYSAGAEIGAGWRKKGQELGRRLHRVELCRSSIRAQEALRHSRPSCRSG